MYNLLLYNIDESKSKLKRIEKRHGLVYYQHSTKSQGTLSIVSSQRKWATERRDMVCMRRRQEHTTTDLNCYAKKYLRPMLLNTTV